MWGKFSDASDRIQLNDAQHIVRDLKEDYLIRLDNELLSVARRAERRGSDATEDEVLFLRRLIVMHCIDTYNRMN